MSLLAPGRNIVLIGLMGTGKSSVGRVVAERLRRRFVDTDAVVEAEAGRSIRDIFERDGERAFREREAAAIRRVAALRGQVIAVGGGAVVDPENVTHLRGTGDLVLLDGSPEVLAERLAGSGDRPLLDGAEESLVERLDRLRAQRDTAYTSAASAVIDTEGRDLAEVVEDVLAWARHSPGVLTPDELR